MGNTVGLCLVWKCHDCVTNIMERCKGRILINSKVTTDDDIMMSVLPKLPLTTQNRSNTYVLFIYTNILLTYDIC